MVLNLNRMPVLFIHVYMDNIFVFIARRRRLRFYNSRGRAKRDRSQKVYYNIHITPNLYGV